MRNDVQRPQEDGGSPKSGRSGGGGIFSPRSLSNYMRIMSSGASNVASTVRSAGATIVSSITDRHEDANRDQVMWAGFDKLECDGDVPRQVLLLGYRSGFQVWDVERADDVRQLVSSDGSASFLQMLKLLIASKKHKDKFADVRPLLAVAGDGSATPSEVNYDGFGSPHNGSGRTTQELGSEHYLPTCVRFYSLRFHDYVHVLKFRSAVFSIRCNSRIVAVTQASQILCLDAATLETEYTILTCPVVLPFPGYGSIGYGPLAVGPRWLAYSGNQVVVSSTTRVSPQDINRATGQLPSTNGSIVAHYAKESRKQLAAGLATLGEKGYKTLSKYYYELLAEDTNCTRNRNLSFKTSHAINAEPAEIDNAGTVIVRDIVSKSIVVQFRAHTSPISALCFDPSGTLLVTASIHGHNINVFQIMPSYRGTSGGSDAKGFCLHLYRLQRGITNAIIQDISFSDDSSLIMISSSRGTSHLYAINPLGGATEDRSTDIKFSNNTSHTPCFLNCSQESDILSSSPVTLSAVSRIRNGINGLKGAVSAAAAATGKVSPLPVAVASAFHNCNSSGPSLDINVLRTRHYFLVFSSAGSIIEYVLRHSNEEATGNDLTGLGTISQGLQQQSDIRLAVEAVQKWDVCYKRNRRDRCDNIDIYGDYGNGEGNKILPKGPKKGTSVYPSDMDKDLTVKHNAEETRNPYIFEAELHTHQAFTPLWAKSKICFQVMMDVQKESGTCSSSEGEIEIERIPIHEIRARSKDLIPLFDNLHIPKVQQARMSASTANLKESLARQKSGLSDDGSLSRASSCGSLESMSEKGVINEAIKGINENSCSPFLHDANKGIVNRCTEDLNAKRQLEVVSNSEGLKEKTCPEFVNSTENEKMDALFVG